jgi:hypothetical protein
MLYQGYMPLQSEIDDKRNANPETGEYGESLVFNDFMKKYKPSDSYEVIWASKKGKKYD